MNPYRIESIQLAHVGPFQKLEILLPASSSNGKAEVHILTGENGTGKTSILEAVGSIFFRFYSFEIVHKLQKVRSGISKVNFSIKPSYSDEAISSSQEDEMARMLGLEYMEPGVLDDQEKVHTQLNNGWYTIVNPPYTAFAYSGYRRAEEENIVVMQDIKEHPLVNATDLTKSINSQIFSQWLIITQTRELIALGKNKSKEAFRHRQNLSIVEQAITEVTSLPTFFELEDNPFQAKINVDGQSLNFDQIPDGLKSIVSWLGDLLMRMDRIQWADDVPVLERPFLLLLDEIDVHLHPAWQRKILPVVQKLFPNAQVIVSTHSPFVVGSVDGAWVHRFVKKDGYSVLAGPPLLSEDALSYEYILEEIFGIKERFGIQVEADLAEFQRLKKQALTRNEAFNETRFQELIQSLGSQSIELESLIGMELKQLQRLTQRSFV